MEENNRNFILAIVLSVIVLVAWDMFYTRPAMQKAKLEEQARLALEKEKASQIGSSTAKPGEQGATSTPSSSQQAAAPAPAALSREAALSAWSSDRVAIDTPSLSGSVALKGGRLDDLILKKYKVAVAPNSPSVTLLSPEGGPEPYYVQYGWKADGASAAGMKLPDLNTEWRAESKGPLTTSNPLKLTYDNGEGLVFHRTVAVDENYMFSVTQEVENKTGKAVALRPYGLVVRRGNLQALGGWILFEGLIGVLGDKGLQEIHYTDALKNRATFDQTGGWVGFTDKYWAVTQIPDQTINYRAEMFGATDGGRNAYQTELAGPAMVVEPGARKATTSHTFAGAKEVGLLNQYEEKLGILRFHMLIDWGWFPFLTKPMFTMLDFFYKMVGNFGVSILIVTVLIKLIFFPLANKSYVSMGRMKKVQPEVERIRERYGDDKMRQQQAIMELYKRENVNPLSGCLPILIQIPVFFALYKVLYTTIEMRQAPFFGWIQDLSMPDPTTIFNLFGLLPYDVPIFLPALGVWPLLMGVTMFIQQRLNPAPSDPVQAQMFNWMPVIFTFMLASFPAGLVIYWMWNNTLTIIQQWVIMRREGVEIKLWENLGLTRKSADSASKT